MRSISAPIMRHSESMAKPTSLFIKRKCRIRKAVIARAARRNDFSVWHAAATFGYGTRAGRSLCTPSPQPSTRNCPRPPNARTLCWDRRLRGSNRISGRVIKRSTAIRRKASKHGIRDLASNGDLSLYFRVRMNSHRPRTLDRRLIFELPSIRQQCSPIYDKT